MCNQGPTIFSCGGEGAASKVPYLGFDPQLMQKGVLFKIKSIILFKNKRKSLSDVSTTTCVVYDSGGRIEGLMA